MALVPPHRYRIEVSGTVAYHDPKVMEGDALYCLDPSGLDGNGKPFCVARSRSAGLRVAGTALDEFAGTTLPYAADHVYAVEVQGKSGVIAFVVSDPPSERFNNGGAWTVKVTDLGVPVAAPQASANPPAAGGAVQQPVAAANEPKLAQPTADDELDMSTGLIMGLLGGTIALGAGGAAVLRSRRRRASEDERERFDVLKGITDATIERAYEREYIEQEKREAIEQVTSAERARSQTTREAHTPEARATPPALSYPTNGAEFTTAITKPGTVLLEARYLPALLHGLAPHLVDQDGAIAADVPLYGGSPLSNVNIDATGIHVSATAQGSAGLLLSDPNLNLQASVTVTDGRLAIHAASGDNDLTAHLAGDLAELNARIAAAGLRVASAVTRNGAIEIVTEALHR